MTGRFLVPTHSVVTVLALVSLLAFSSRAQSCAQYATASSLRFKPRSEGYPYSFLFEQNQANVSMIRSRPFPPIIIQVLDSNGAVDYVGSSDVFIQVSSIARLATSSPVQVVNGEAIFTHLTVDGIDPWYDLVFTALSGSPLAVVGKKLTIKNVTNLFDLISAYDFSFAQNRTFIQYPTQNISIVFGYVVPTITLNILNSQYMTYPSSGSLGSNFTAIASTSVPSVVLSGNVVPIIDGEASFTNLILNGPASVTSIPRITFTLYDAGTPIKQVSSGTVTIVASLIDYSYIAFEGESTSFFYAEGQRASATSGVALPEIQITLRNNMKTRSPDTSGLVITATSPGVSLIENTVGVINGVASFTKLAFPTGTEGSFFVIVFTAGAQGSLPLAGTSIRTGWISVSATVLPAASLRFVPSSTDSLINFQGESIGAVLFLPLAPIRIQVLSSSNAIDTTPIEVRATASSGVNMGETSSKSNGGIVEFTTLQFTSTAANVYPRITFTAVAPTLPVHGSYITSGVVTIAAIQANFDLRFQPTGVGLFARPGIGTVATIAVPLPPIIIELVSSSGDLDPSSSEISITATAAGATLSGSFMRVTAGVAIFDSLTFVSEVAGSFVITFTAGSESNAPVAGKRLLTGAVRVANAVTAAFAIRFAPVDSYIGYGGQSVPVTIGKIPGASGPITGNKVPPIIIELIDSVHNVSSAAVPITVICSLPTTAMFSVAQSGTPKQQSYFPVTIPVGGSKATFSELYIASGSAPFLTFKAIAGPQDAINGYAITSGALSLTTTANVLQSQTSPFGSLQVVSVSGKSFVRNRQSIAIDAGTSMSITLQLWTIGGLPAGNLTSVVSVSITSNVALKPPLIGTVNNVTGQVSFDTLQFSQSVGSSVKPILVFSASSPGVTSIFPTSTGMVTVIGPSAQSGVDVVAQILFDFSGFDTTSWLSILARRLNIESSRLLVTRVYYGTGADPSPTPKNTTANAVAVWYGTRLDFRVLEPLATSRNSKAAWAVANSFLNIKMDCGSAPELYLRKSMNLSSDNTCDWFAFNDQLTSAQQCALAVGEDGYCSCFVNMLSKMGLNCLGYSTMTDLCLNTLLSSANCQDPTIVSVCSLLQAAPVPRITLLASGIMFAFLLAPLMYLKDSGFFHKLQRPEAHASFPLQVKTNFDESDML